MQFGRRDFVKVAAGGPMPSMSAARCWRAARVTDMRIAGNTRRGNSDMDGDLDNLNWTMARQVGELRVA
ncbi:hypothetical protein FBZ94_101814 [Bradyrhizobium sacchari]|uniref:Uncharacterized protein n=1 Tax=Bradyrhizobium sacchari TaxID=1399419 RepID=A0A560J7E7_9BRAD|nr:hypothetical protein FBZ94_101814 [Bradyrhizobium sacchari]TWB84370.1 hypothetical protein FBZ95_101814 [Bradyrhizobium sacchari]